MVVLFNNLKSVTTMALKAAQKQAKLFKNTPVQELTYRPQLQTDTWQSTIKKTLSSSNQSSPISSVVAAKNSSNAVMDSLNKPIEAVVSLDDIKNNIFGIKLSSKLKSQLKFKGNLKYQDGDLEITIQKINQGYSLKISPIVKEAAESLVPSAEHYKVLEKYVSTTRYKDINKALEKLAKGEQITDPTLIMDIKYLTELINMQKPLQVAKNLYRSEADLEALRNIKTSFGDELLQKMSYVIQKKSQPNLSVEETQQVNKLIEQIENEFKKVDIGQIQQSHFMSTSTVPSGILSKGHPLVYKLEAKPGSVGLDVNDFFLDDFIASNSSKDQAIVKIMLRDKEFLLQRNSVIDVSKIYFDKNLNSWVVDAAVQNAKI